MKLCKERSNQSTSKIEATQMFCAESYAQVMIANISPSHLSYEDTLNTLKYANRAKNIRVSASQQLIQPDDHVRTLDAR